MVPKDGQMKTRPMNHPHDHIHHKDEAFQYQGTQHMKMVEQFVKEKHPTVVILQGFPLLGKTRTSKEFACLLAEQFRGVKDGAKEVHTFLFDLRYVESAEKLPSYIHDVCKAKILGWDFDDIKNVDQLCDAFGKANDGEKVFILVLDNIDRVHDQERPKILEFIQGFAASAKNVHLVVTSVTDVNLVRDPNMIMKYRLKPLEPDCAKKLLRETSGNPEGFDGHADDTVRLVGGSPLALMIAGNEMNKKCQLPYTPEEFVEVLKDSSSLALNLDNSPTDDQLVKRITDIVKDNFNELEKLVIAMDDPRVFTPEDLRDAMAAAFRTTKPAWEIKKIVLYVLRKSMYGYNEENGSAESTPLVIEILKEAFCQMTSKDGFLKDFNRNLVNTLDDTSHLMKSIARGLRQAEIHLLRNQEGPNVRHQEVQELRLNVITKACELLQTIGVDAKTRNVFHSQSLHIKKECEKLETKPDRIKVGIQESYPNHTGKSAEKELEARISPIFPDLVPNVKENKALASPTPAVQAANVRSSKETKQVDKADKKNKESGAKEQNECEKTLMGGITTVAGETTASCSVKTTVTEEGNSKTANGNQDKCMTPVSFSNIQLSVPGSLHSTNCREPSQESLSLHGTYSDLPTRPDNHVLTSSPDIESKMEGDQQDVDKGCNGLASKEAMESEFDDWERGDAAEEGESTEEANVNREPCFTVPRADRKEHLAGSETNGEGSKSLHLQAVQTAVVTSNTRISKATTSGRPTDILQQSRPQDGRNETRGQGILGLSPAAVSFDSRIHQPAPRFPSHYNPASYQNPSFSQMRYPLDGSFMPASQPVQEQNYLAQGSLSLPNVQWDRFNNTPYNGGSSGHYNQFGREYNERDYNQGQGSLQQSNVQCDRFPTPYSGGTGHYNHFGREYNQHDHLESQNLSSIPMHQFTNKFDELSLGHEPPPLSDVSYSPLDFQLQQPMGVNPPQMSPFHSLVSTPPRGYQARPPPDRIYQGCGPPHDINASSQNSRLRSPGPSSRFRQPYRPPSQYVSTPPSQSHVQSPRFPQAQGPPFQSMGMPPSPCFHPRGPPSRNVQSPPHTLRTYGVFAPCGTRNGPSSQPYQGDHGHRQHGQYQPRSRYDQRNGQY